MLNAVKTNYVPDSNTKKAYIVFLNEATVKLAKTFYPIGPSLQVRQDSNN